MDIELLQLTKKETWNGGKGRKVVVKNTPTKHRENQLMNMDTQNISKKWSNVGEQSLLKY